MRQPHVSHLLLLGRKTLGLAGLQGRPRRRTGSGRGLGSPPPTGTEKVTCSPAHVSR